MTRWRRWALPAALVALVALGAVIIVLLAPPAKTNIYLDPADGGGYGARALADLLGERGQQVIRAYSAGEALGSLGPPGSTTLVITSPDLLTSVQRRMLARAHADLFLVEAGPLSARTVAPGLSVKNYQPSRLAGPPQSQCGLAAARLAGPASLVPGYTYGGTAPAGALACYRAGGQPALLRFPAGGRTVTLLGSGLPLTNGALTDDGNAALALNLLAGHRRIVWLTPEPPLGTVIPGIPGARGRSGPGLLPHGVHLLLWELLVALVLAVVWRARRFGPLITERLPVVVRASETVEGHARLYQARRSRGRAAAALRDAMLSRVLPALGMVAGSPPEAVESALASRSRRSETDVRTLVYGPDPASDAELVQLADNLDELEKEVRSL